MNFKLWFENIISPSDIINMIRNNENSSKIADAAMQDKRNALDTMSFASYFGNIDLLKELINRGVKINGSWSEPTAFNAVEGGHIDVLKFLIDNGADLSLGAESGDFFQDKYAALIKAADMKRSDMVNLILSNIDEPVFSDAAINRPLIMKWYINNNKLNDEVIEDIGPRISNKEVANLLRPIYPNIDEIMKRRIGGGW